MKKYDLAKAKRFIEAHKSDIKCASLGMDEDWFRTAETVFENGKYFYNLDDSNLKIGGMRGSKWATPVLEIEYKDGSIKIYNCYVGESDGKCPAHFELSDYATWVQIDREKQMRFDIED